MITRENYFWMNAQCEITLEKSCQMEIKIFNFQMMNYKLSDIDSYKRKYLTNILSTKI